MKKLGLIDILLAKGMDFKMKTNLLKIPTIYLCESVRDFEVERLTIDNELSSIYFQNVHLGPELTHDGKVCQYIQDNDQELLGFWISDRNSRLNVFWQSIGQRYTTEEKIYSFIENPRFVDSVVLAYNKTYDNNFIMLIEEDSYKRGIEKVMQEIWPVHNL